MANNNRLTYQYFSNQWKDLQVVTKIPNTSTVFDDDSTSGTDRGKSAHFMISRTGKFDDLTLWYYRENNILIGITTGNYSAVENEFGVMYIVEFKFTTPFQNENYGWIYYFQNTAQNQWNLYQQAGGTGNATIKQSQDVVSSLMANNAVIWQNLLFCARFSNHLTTEQKRRVVSCYKNLDESNTKILNDGNFSQKQTSFPNGLIDYNSNLQALVNNPSLQGVAIGGILTTIVVVAIAVTVLSLVAYGVYKDYLKRSELDVKWSTDTANLLRSKLTESEYAQVENELGQKVWAGYQSGLKEGKSKQLATIGIIGILALLFIVNPTGKNE